MTETTAVEFHAFRKIPRLSREITVTEKIDGTNAVIKITDTGEFLVGSRTRWITPEDDNFGFAAWAYDNKQELLRLGPGTHYGEWWGKGIQRNYGLAERRFSLFNTAKWQDDVIRPKCCHVVPVILKGIFDSQLVNDAMNILYGHSWAAPGFKDPEGVVVFHAAGNCMFKKTFDSDNAPKSL